MIQSFFELSRMFLKIHRIYERFWIVSLDFIFPYFLPKEHVHIHRSAAWDVASKRGPKCTLWNLRKFFESMCEIFFQYTKTIKHSFGFRNTVGMWHALDIKTRQLNGKDNKNIFILNSQVVSELCTVGTFSIFTQTWHHLQLASWISQLFISSTNTQDSNASSSSHFRSRAS